METIILTKYSKHDDLAISTFDIFAPKNVKCADGNIVTFQTLQNMRNVKLLHFFSQMLPEMQTQTQAKKAHLSIQKLKNC